MEVRQSLMEDTIRVAANAIVVRDGKALLVGFDDEAGSHYNFPGGGVEVGETLADTLRRETLEETCLEIEVGRLLLVVESVGSRNHNLIDGSYVPWNEVRFFFLCAPASQQAAAQMPEEPDDSQTAIRWLPLEELPDLPVLPQVSAELLAAIREDRETPLVVPNPHKFEHVNDPAASD